MAVPRCLPIPSSTPPVLVVDGLTVEYRPLGEAAQRVLDGVDLTLHAGEAVGLNGVSGSGKTSLAKALLGLLPGAARVLGGRAKLRPIRESDGSALELLADLADRRHVAPWRGVHISMVAQEPERALHPLLCAADQVVEVLRAHRPWPAAYLKRRAMALLREVGLDADELAEAFPHQLSGGQRQRLVIAQAIACRPAVLLADEPTAALDPLATRRLVALLQDLRRRHGMALLWISHDPVLLRRATDRQLTLTGGRLLASDAAAATDAAADGGQ